jgi:hypothetical protein
MKKNQILLIAAFIVAIGATVFLIQRKQKQTEELNAEIRSASFDQHLDSIKENTAWLSRQLKYEDTLADLMFRIGYTHQQIHDSIRASQDRVYFDTVRPYFNRRELLWYAAFRVRDSLDFISRKTDLQTPNKKISK